MTNNLHTSEDDDEVGSAEDQALPSKSQRKREAAEILQLGQTLSELAPSELEHLPIGDSVRDALLALHKITRFGARKRQLHYLAKLLRNSDCSEIKERLASMRRSASEQTQLLHNTEQWRDRLLVEGDSAVTDLLLRYPQTDRQRLRQLLRNHQREQAKMGSDNDRGTKASREIFKLLRAEMEKSDD